MICSVQGMAPRDRDLKETPPGTKEQEAHFPPPTPFPCLPQCQCCGPMPQRSSANPANTTSPSLHVLQDLSSSTAGGGLTSQADNHTLHFWGQPNTAHNRQREPLQTTRLKEKEVKNQQRTHATHIVDIP